MRYCPSRYHTLRRETVEVQVGSVGIGGPGGIVGKNPVRIQSMTTTDTQDVAATVRQSIALAEVGCEIVRVTAPNVTAARALRDIRQQLTAAGFGHIPLVADIHFLPSAAMEAVEHVEKVRVNPGNYADKKKFAVTEYSDADYERELQRIYDAFTPLVLRAKALGRALRIGTNHGSLSDRIMNRYGDTPLGMVESALEFLRICESHNFRDIVLSMKASNPKVMIQAYRLLVARMDQEDMHYPLHLGVTEAGDGEDGRIKSAIGIGSLLYDGLGDTIRVSLTEDSVYEIPVAQKLAAKAHALWQQGGAGVPPASETDSIDPYRYTRREILPVELSPGLPVGPDHPPRVFSGAGVPPATWHGLPAHEVARASSPCAAGVPPAPQPPALPPRDSDTPVEGRVHPISDADALRAFVAQAPRPQRDAGNPPASSFRPADVLALSPALSVATLESAIPEGTLASSLILLRPFTGSAADIGELTAFATFARARNHALAIATTAEALPALAPVLRTLPAGQRLIFTLDTRAPASPPALPLPQASPTARYRALAEALRALAPAPAARAPIWIRNTAETAIRATTGDSPDFLSRLLDAAILTGSLLCDGVGDLVSVETDPDPVRANKLAYNILQGAGARVTKTEYVACPSCGRTLFDLQTTTQRIRQKTGHLKGVKLAIMGCIVNGPGEMADADFGYVGGAPGKINLYVGKNCVQYNIPQAEADARLIELIKQHGKWMEPAEQMERAGG
ncbi:1-hydroxy-2-methyl-2-(E)-butenyl 4-diphosphate synthase [Opitutaceae bacterium TAV5]|nr:1-hydroxy-2-methyl-2-(E)-butenyl 4-diphosphate synthase [Opitutaceae bacterium TAV5]